MADYFQHWLTVGEQPGRQLPKIYYVNWFQKYKNGKFIWPGFGENSRVLKWIVERTDGLEHATETPIGNIPAEGALDLSGLDLDESALTQLFEVDSEAWGKEVEELRNYFQIFGDRLPQGIRDELDSLETRLKG